MSDSPGSVCSCVKWEDEGEQNRDAPPQAMLTTAITHLLPHLSQDHVTLSCDKQCAHSAPTNMYRIYTMSEANNAQSSAWSLRSERVSMRERIDACDITEVIV